MYTTYIIAYTHTHRVLLSNFLAQTEALMTGKTEDEVRAELKSKGMNDKQIEDILPHKVTQHLSE